MADFSIQSQLTSQLRDRLNFGEINSNNNSVLNSKNSSGPSSAGPSFEETLKSTLNEVNETIQTADKAAKDFAVGKAENLHDVMISMEKADIALRTVTAVRGKLVEAYQEIMRMPV